jgi:very-short-patch-repair endonuclease
LVFSLSEIPTDRVVWIRHFHPNDLDRAVAAAPSDAPAVISQRTAGSWSQSATVTSSLDEMEVVAGQLFPTWLPGAESITASTGAAPTAVRALAITHAAGTAQYGPFLADLATGALVGSGTYTRRHQPEVRALGLARVLAASFGRSACALLLRPPDNLDEGGTLALVRAAQWLVEHGRLAVWICGGSLPAVDCLPEVVVAQLVPDASVVRPGPEVSSTPRHGLPVNGRPRRKAPVGNPWPLRVIGKPHPTSRAEVVLETALASRPWAAGRAWNHTVRPGPLVNPVRVDLLWKRERCIVEIDGDDHRAAGKYAEDRSRDVVLQLSGYAVLRFTNTQVLDDIENLLALLQQFLATRRRAGKGNRLVGQTVDDGRDIYAPHSPGGGRPGLQREIDSRPPLPTEEGIAGKARTVEPDRG